MEKYRLVCLKCRRKFEDKEHLMACPICGGQLRVDVNYSRLVEKIKGQSDFLAVSSKAPPSMWKYFDFLPLLDRKNIVSLNEGDTPLLKSQRLGDELRIHLQIKLEIGNPSGSFKDRQVSIGVSKAVEMSKRGVLTISSGNVGAAVSMYSARAGLPAFIFVHEMAPDNKILQIVAYGGNCYRVHSNSTSEIIDATKSLVQDFGLANLITASPVNPYINHGAKTIAYEIVASALTSPDTPFPDVIVVPVGGGGLLALLYQGFKDLQELDVIDRIPRFVAAQPAGCAPLVKAFNEQIEIEHIMQMPWPDVNTIATALADDIPLDARLSLPALQESGGAAIAITDDLILRGMKALATREGVFCEPSSAITLPALEYLRNEGHIDPGEVVILLITGSGFKDLASWQQVITPAPLITFDQDWHAIVKNRIQME